jgi:hypothetical protein
VEWFKALKIKGKLMATEVFQPDGENGVFLWKQPDCIKKGANL